MIDLGEAAGSLLLNVTDRVATVSLHRPETKNAVTYAMWLGLSRLLPALDADDGVDVVVLRGTPGGPFSSGADIGEFRTLRAGPDGAERYGAAVEAGERALLDCRTPTVALVEGFAIGGGTQLALACDLRVCEPGSRFGITPARLGIVYALGSTARLVEVVGAAWARWILLTGELLDAPTALRIGLVHEVSESPASRAREIVESLTSRARVSQVGASALIDRCVAGRTDVDEDVQALYRASWEGPEYAEGVAAFLAKRPADFRAARER